MVDPSSTWLLLHLLGVLLPPPTHVQPFPLSFPLLCAPLFPSSPAPSFLFPSSALACACSQPARWFCRLKTVVPRTAFCCPQMAFLYLATLQNPVNITTNKNVRNRTYIERTSYILGGCKSVWHHGLPRGYPDLHPLSSGQTFTFTVHRHDKMK